MAPLPFTVPLRAAALKFVAHSYGEPGLPWFSLALIDGMETGDGAAEVERRLDARTAIENNCKYILMEIR